MRPPMMAIFFKKCIIWFWSAKLLWPRAAPNVNNASTAAADRAVSNEKKETAGQFHDEGDPIGGLRERKVRGTDIADRCGWHGDFAQSRQDEEDGGEKPAEGRQVTMSIGHGESPDGLG